MRTIQRAIAVLALVVSAATSARGDETRSQVLERLREEELARQEARAADESREKAAREEHARALEAERERAASSAREAVRAFAARREAMREWHAAFATTIRPVLDARTNLYRRMSHRMFAAVRPACAAFETAVEAATPGYRTAPERRIEAMARDLLAVYRDSAHQCVEGAYFSFTVREAQVRRIVDELIVALAPYDLEFPSAGRPAVVSSRDSGKMMRSHQ